MNDGSPAAPPRRRGPGSAARLLRGLAMAALTAVSLGSALLPQTAGAWRQWGGPGRDFMVADAGLAVAWPDGGPRLLWERPLGEGYSAIAVADGSLYTMLRRGDQEVAIALDARDGSTLWEHAYPTDLSALDTSQGPGPNTTPLVLEDRVLTIGSTGSLRALDRDDGSLLWKVELWGEMGGTVRDRGYSSSLLAYGGSVIALVGGDGQAVVAFDPTDGSVRWAGGDFANGHSSPIVIDVGGQEQVVAFLAAEVAGIEVGTGRTLWSIEHPTNWGLNISTPVWGDDGVLYVSSAYSGGSRAIRLRRAGDTTEASELWFSSRMRVHIGTAIRSGDRVCGSSGDFGPAFLTCIDVQTGQLLWQDRSFAKASLIAAGDLFVLLDEEGSLALARLDDEGAAVLARTELFDSLSWTVPTLVGTRLYARNRVRIAALDLGR